MSKSLSIAPLLALSIASGCASRSRVWQKVDYIQQDDRLVVRVENSLFTEYLFGESASGEPRKYPYFFPVNAPTTGASLTTESAEPYPHHHSLFFACDRVNGGNFWQEGLERGRIVQDDLKIVDHRPDVLTFETTNRWVREGFESPLRDKRRITIAAPGAKLRIIELAIELTAQTDVTIGQTNHALFSARMAPELAADAGGSLMNRDGKRGEKETFGQRSTWMDYGDWRKGVFEGLAIFNHPSNPWSPPPWFTRNYGFFSPNPFHFMEEERFRLPAGQSLELRYLVVVHAGVPREVDLDALYDRWIRFGAQTWTNDGRRDG